MLIYLIKRGLKIRTYLEDFGVYKEQISIRSFSNYFPLAIARMVRKNLIMDSGQTIESILVYGLWMMNLLKNLMPGQNLIRFLEIRPSMTFQNF
ncbi:unnamed protein product [Bathycoccus prasinos]